MTKAPEGAYKGILASSLLAITIHLSLSPDDVDAE